MTDIPHAPFDRRIFSPSIPLTPAHRLTSLSLPLSISTELPFLIRIAVSSSFDSQNGSHFFFYTSVISKPYLTLGAGARNAEIICEK